jgi:hypothetical protein
MTRPGEYLKALASKMRRTVDDYRRVAVAFIAPEASAAERAWAVDWLDDAKAEDLARALAEDQVDQLFLHAAEASGLAEQLPRSLLDRLTERRMAVAVSVIRQEHMLHEVSTLLDEMAVAHVVLKGALARPLLYAKPYLRPSADVDLLVAPAASPKVARALERRGYTLTVAPHSDTHEVWLEKLGAGLDLHWSLLRPGRMRRDITEEILAGRVRRGGLWGPSDVHLTMAMLVHPAITDYVTARLISASDLDRWLRRQPAPWNEVVELLGRIDLRTAAWTMLLWTHGLLGTPVPAEVWRGLDPGRVRRKYLEAWLGRHPARLYARRPNLVRGLFSLALQDQARGAARAVWRVARKKRFALDGKGDS